MEGKLLFYTCMCAHDVSLALSPHTAHTHTMWTLKNVNLAAVEVQSIYFCFQPDSLVPKLVLVCPKEKLVLVAEAPNRPVAVLGVAVAAPNRPPVPAAMGLDGPFLPAW